MRKLNQKVDDFLRETGKWQVEMEKLREIILDCDLEEEFKWYQPCYTLNGRNVVLIHGFKEYCAILFFNGSLMKDPDGILIQQTENVQAARQIRFTNLQQIVRAEATLKNYVHEAMEVEKSGRKVEHKKTADYPVAEEFRVRLERNPALRTAFESLTPGRQRAYLFYFSSAKQSSTRELRIEKYVQNILDGKGLND